MTTNITLPSDARLLDLLEAKGCHAQLYARDSDGVTRASTVKELRLLADLMATECCGTYRVLFFHRGGEVQAARFTLRLRGGSAVWSADWAQVRVLRSWVPGAWNTAATLRAAAVANGLEARTETLAEWGCVRELRELGLIAD